MKIFFAFPALFLAVLFILGAGCSTTAPDRTGTQSAGSPVTLSIQPDITRYTVIMSSTVGIGLTPQINGTLPAGNLTYVWKTDYGHFLSWEAPDYKVQERGDIVTVNDTKVYWTYLYANASAPRPPVHITLDVIDPSTGATLGHAEQTIGWDTGNDTAVIG
jgi:hypothetical protein